MITTLMLMFHLGLYPLRLSWYSHKHVGVGSADRVSHVRSSVLHCFCEQCHHVDLQVVQREVWASCGHFALGSDTHKRLVELLKIK